MQTDDFRIKCYGLSELAILYNPGVLPGTALKRLNVWIQRHARLSADLTNAGWSKGTRLLNPRQVSIIVQHLGAP
ncbi:MAG: DUF4248 domain-containing protein [Tannerellaceae bacterium]|jgi:hypothetical protein|nr:DUF4248 domain-containing protein [Tannerellaceae bacterium]